MACDRLESETVLVRRRRSAQDHVFHTDPDCRRVTDDHKEKPREVLPDDYEECSFCDGSASRGKPHGTNVATLVMEAATESESGESELATKRKEDE